MLDILAPINYLSVYLRASIEIAPVAQWIERQPPELKAAGSNPAGRTNKIKGLREIVSPFFIVENLMPNTQPIFRFFFIKNRKRKIRTANPPLSANLKLIVLYQLCS